MKVLSDIKACNFVDLKPGEFFCALREPRLFGLCVSDGARNGALIFSKVNGQRGTPWVAAGGLPNDTLLAFPSAVARPDFASASNSDFEIGHIISAGDEFYIRASDGMGGYRTFDLKSGALSTQDDKNAAVCFRSWQIGHLREHDKFDALFKFPDGISSN